MKRCMFLLAMITFGIAAQAQGYITNLAPSQFKSAVEADARGKLIDVRQPWEFKNGHIANAINIDVMSDEFEAQVSKIPRDTPIYVYCFSGGRSAEAAEKLKAMGFRKIVNLSGGVAAWEKALLPLVK